MVLIHSSFFVDQDLAIPTPESFTNTNNSDPILLRNPAAIFEKTYSGAFRRCLGFKMSGIVKLKQNDLMAYKNQKLGHPKIPHIEEKQ